jgi:hypothetical protein
MNRRILGLACIFTVICILIIIQWISNQHARPITPESKPQLDRVSTTSPAKSEEVPAPKVPSVEENPKPVVTQEPESAVEPDVANQRMDVTAIITFEGKPVEGAMYRVQWAGPRLPPSTPFTGLLRKKARSRSDGMSKTTVAYPPTLPGDSIFYAVAYHPEIGSAYATFTLDELSQQPIQLELERGTVIRGALLDETGQLVPHGRLELLSESPNTQINLSGLEVETKEDGTFTMAGIRFDNNPTLLLAYCLQPSGPSQFSENRPRPRSLPKQVGMTRKALEGVPVQDGQIIDAGSIQLPVNLTSMQK